MVSHVQKEIVYWTQNLLRFPTVASCMLQGKTLLITSKVQNTGDYVTGWVGMFQL
jgi:hypothetical protein